MKKAVLVAIALLVVSASLVSCGYSNNSYVYKPPSGLLYRVLASQGVNAVTDFGRLVMINGQYDVLPRVAPLSAGTSPGLMAISPSRSTLMSFDSAANAVYGIDTVHETVLAQHIALQGPTFSMSVPTSSQVGYAAVPSASVNGFEFLGAVDVLNLSPPGGLTTTIAVTNAQMVIANSTGSQLLVFSNGSDSVTVLTPSNAAPPVDTSCVTNPPNSVCTIVPGFDRPVYAVISGSTAYVLNCGAECGGVQASVQTLDLNSLAVGTPVPVNGATVGLIVGSQLYVAGNGTPTGPLCSSITNAATTAATYCGTLDIVDLTTMTDPYFNNPATEIAVPNGFHHRIDISENGQLFVGSHTCTNIGDVGNPTGEVRGCLAIYNTTNGSVIFPPDNGDVNGLQSFSQRDVEYVAEGGNLRVYDTTKDILLINDFVPNGTIDIVGYVGDVKAIDFF